jgi:predicted dinucleotide-utilizing enzyme
MLRRSEVSSMIAPSSTTLRVGVGGLGAIGWPVVRRLAEGMPGLVLAAVAASDLAKAEARLAGCGIAAEVVTAAELAERADIVIESLPAAHFRAIAEPAVGAGRVFLPLSVGALLDHFDLVERAKVTGARIIVPTGALLGLDAVRAAAEGEIRSARLITRKPPGGLAGAPYLVANGVSLLGLDRPLKVFDGTARGGAGARRYRTRPHPPGDLGRPGVAAQRPPRRDRCRCRPPDDDDRERAFGREPAHWTADTSERDCLPAAPHRNVASRQLTHRAPLTIL